MWKKGETTPCLFFLWTNMFDIPLTFSSHIMCDDLEKNIFASYFMLISWTMYYHTSWSLVCCLYVCKYLLGFFVQSLIRNSNILYFNKDKDVCLYIYRTVLCPLHNYADKYNFFQQGYEKTGIIMFANIKDSNTFQKKKNAVNNNFVT